MKKTLVPAIKYSISRCSFSVGLPILAISLHCISERGHYKRKLLSSPLFKIAFVFLLTVYPYERRYVHGDFSMEHAFAVVPREIFKETRPSRNRVTRVRARPERNENTRQTNAAATSMLRVRMLRNEVN